MNEIKIDVIEFSDQGHSFKKKRKTGRLSPEIILTVGLSAVDKIS
jgi:hypothetical protein